MADQIVTAAQAAVKAEVATVKSKIVAFVKAHVATAIAAVAGYGVAKLGLISLIWKLV